MKYVRFSDDTIVLISAGEQHSDAIRLFKDDSGVKPISAGTCNINESYSGDDAFYIDAHGESLSLKIKSLEEDQTMMMKILNNNNVPFFIYQNGDVIVILNPKNPREFPSRVESYNGFYKIVVHGFVKFTTEKYHPYEDNPEFSYSRVKVTVVECSTTPKDQLDEAYNRYNCEDIQHYEFTIKNVLGINRY